MTPYLAAAISAQGPTEIGRVRALRILYLSYDGLTGFLAQSQVWSYIRALSSVGHQFDLISFEHPERYAETGDKVARETAARGVAWHPRRFRHRPPILAKILDLRDMQSTARRLVRAGGIEAIHARSYVAGDVALALKRKFGVPFIFDMRGFWVDERLDGGRWPQSNPFYRALYRRWKAKERAMIAGADRIVVLTEAARDEITAWPDYRGQPISVIPCSVDHQVFDITTPHDRSEARGRLGIAEEAFVLVYLGSIGTVYLLREMLDVFSRIKRAKPGAQFLLVGWYDKAAVLARAAGLEISPNDIVIQPAEHGEVPYWLGAADVAIALRRPSFSSIGASPTKLAEYFACGLPVIVNDRVGDVAQIVRNLDAGIVLSQMAPDEVDRAVSDVDRLLATDRGRLRARSQEIHDLPNAVATYDTIYRSLEGPAQ